MSSRNADDRMREAGGVASLLDGAFGFFVWAVHLLVIYVATALACVLGLGAAPAPMRLAFLAGLGVVTAATVGLVALHAFRRHRQLRPYPARRFQWAVVLGCDALAAVAIAGQLLPILLVPLCV